jgi:hypothetical protein
MANFTTNTTVDDKTYDTLTYFVDVHLSIVLIILGILANIVSFIVLGRDKSMKKPARTLLRGLAVTDSAFLVVYSIVISSVSFVEITYGRVRTWVRTFISIAYAIGTPVGSTLQTTCLWMVLAVTADRYIAVCWPFHALRYSTTTRARATIVAIWIAAVIFNIPRFFELRLVQKEANETFYKMEFNLYGNDAYWLIYGIILYWCFRFVIPFGALIFFNVRLLQTIIASNRAHLDSTNISNDKRNITMIIVMVTVFLTCNLPVVINRICSLSECQYNTSYTNFFLLVNSSTNFILYYFLGQRFRHTLWKLVKCPCTCNRSTHNTHDAGDVELY